MTHIRHATAIALAALAAACSPAKPAAPPVSAAPAPTSVATPSRQVNAFGILPSVLGDCPSGLTKVADIKVDLSNINPYLPAAKFAKKDPQGNDMQIKSGAAAGHPVPTQLDFDMDLQKLGDSVTVTVTVPKLDKDLFFRDSPADPSKPNDPAGSIRSTWAITAAEPNGKDMLCGPVFVDSSKKSATFTAYYDPSTKPVFGSFNIGLIVKGPPGNVPKTFSLPVFLDPNVKNNG